MWWSQKGSKVNHLIREWEFEWEIRLFWWKKRDESRSFHCCHNHTSEINLLLISHLSSLWNEDEWNFKMRKCMDTWKYFDMLLGIWGTKLCVTDSEWERRSTKKDEMCEIFSCSRFQEISKDSSFFLFKWNSRGAVKNKRNDIPGDWFWTKHWEHDKEQGGERSEGDLIMLWLSSTFQTLVYILSSSSSSSPTSPNEISEFKLNGEKKKTERVRHEEAYNKRDSQLTDRLIRRFISPHFACFFSFHRLFLLLHLHLRRSFRLTLNKKKHIKNTKKMFVKRIFIQLFFLI